MSTTRFETDGPIAIVSIDRPAVRNCVDGPTAAELAAAFRRFDADESLAVAILTGLGGTFCAGADLKGVSESRGNQVRLEGDGPMGPSRMLLGKPVIAAVEGFAVAGGLELALWCDMRVAAEDAVFGVYCRRWGVPLIDGGTIRLTRLVGHSHALDLILTGRGVAGDEARALAKQLAAFPQRCLRSDRLSSYRQWELPLEQALRVETELGLEVIRSGETLEGATRFAKGAGRHGSFGD